MMAVSVGLGVGYVTFARVPAETQATFGPSVASSRPDNA